MQVNTIVSDLNLQQMKNGFSQMKVFCSCVASERLFGLAEATLDRVLTLPLPPPHLFVFPLPAGLFGGFPLSAGPLRLLPGFLHGQPVWRTQDPPVHRPGEGHPGPGLPGTQGGWLAGSFYPGDLRALLFPREIIPDIGTWLSK